MALYQTNYNYGPGVKNGPMLWGFRFHISKYLKIFLSKTVRAKAFIFGIWHHIVALYQNPSNCGCGVKISPVLWGLGFHRDKKKKTFRNLLVPDRKG